MYSRRYVASGYWSKNRNRFDGVITLGGVLTELVRYAVRRQLPCPKLSQSLR